MINLPEELELRLPLHVRAARLLMKQNEEEALHGKSLS